MLDRNVIGLPADGEWPLEITLGHLNESEAARQIKYVRTWIDAWQQWHGNGTLAWQERCYRNLGTQRLPYRLQIDSPDDVAAWLGETNSYRSARERYSRLSARWPLLVDCLPRHFDMLAGYSEVDFERLESLLVWLHAHPGSNLYPRQLPIDGLDSKWLENRQGLVAELVAVLRGNGPGRNGLLPNLWSASIATPDSDANPRSGAARPRRWSWRHHSACRRHRKAYTSGSIRVHCREPTDRAGI